MSSVIVDSFYLREGGEMVGLSVKLSLRLCRRGRVPDNVSICIIGRRIDPRLTAHGHCLV